MQRKVKSTTGFRPLETAKLIELWLGHNPNSDVSELIRESIKLNPEIKKLAGKKFASALK